MPVYNNEKYLPLAVKSIQEQTFTDWELIIVDDGSTDNTPQIADKLAEKDNRIKVIHQENQWIFKSYNNGIAAANGKYVFIVNSDDTINPESLQKIYDVAEIDDADMVIFNMTINICDENQSILNYDIYNMKKALNDDFSYNDLKQIHTNWIDWLKLRLVGHQCVYKSSLAKSIKYRTDTYAGDFFYNIQIADSLKAVAGTSYVVYNHYVYENECMNASVGKYYGYEHTMFNEFYMNYKKLFENWGVWNDKIHDYLTANRLNNLTNEIRSYQAKNCKLSVNEKIKYIIEGASDDIVYKNAVETGRREEWESRILSGLRELLVKEDSDETSDYYFMYEMLDSLLRYEKDNEDLDKIKNAVYNPLNPQNIGECFYMKLK